MRKKFAYAIIVPARKVIMYDMLNLLSVVGIGVTTKLLRHNAIRCTTPCTKYCVMFCFIAHFIDIEHMWTSLEYNERWTVEKIYGSSFRANLKEYMDKAEKEPLLIERRDVCYI